MTAALLAPPTARLVRWRYHFTDFRTGRYLTALPLSDVTLNDVLNGASDGTGNVNLSSSAIRSRDPFGSTVPRRTCMWAERQEVDPASKAILYTEVPWGGVVMGRERTHSSRVMKLSMVTWAAYFQRRLVGDATFTQADKFRIMRWLVSQAAQQPAVTGLPGVSPHLSPLAVSYVTNTLVETAALPMSGVLADRTYLATDLKPALQAMTELGSSGAGFDWRLVPYMAVPGDLSSFRVRLDLGYPRLGRVAPADLRWSTDPADSRSRWGFVEDLTIKEDGSAVNNRITAVGSGTGTDQIRATADSSATATDELANGYPLYESSLTSSTSEDRTTDTVYGKALGALLTGFASEVVVSGIKVRGDLAPRLSSYSVGDDITAKVADTMTGRTETFMGQLTGRSVAPAQPGRSEQVTMDVQGTVAP